MIKNRSVNILIVALLLLGIMAVTLWFFIEKSHDDFADKIKVSENGVTEKVFTVRDLMLNPSESKEYTVELVCDASGSYDISLDFEEKHNGGMKKFVSVTVTCGDDVVYEGNLTKLLDKNSPDIEFDGELYAEDPLPITIRYEIPRNIGNEAQGTSADFDIHVKIKKN